MFAPNGLEQSAGSSEVYRVAFVEVRFRLSRHDRGEQEDHVGQSGRELRRDVGGGDVKGLADDRKRRLEWRGRDDVDQMRPVDRLLGQAAVARQSLRELATDHPGRADDEHVHGSAAFLDARGALAFDNERHVGQFSRSRET